MSTILDQQLNASLAVTPQQPNIPIASEVTPMALLQIAMSQNADLEKLDRLMQMQERWERRQAEKAFYEAMGEFKKNPPKIVRNKHVRYQTQKGITEYDHSTLDHVCDQITAALSVHGITHKWIPKQNGAKISVTCILTHKLGYSDPEPPTLEASPDESGSKNAIQGIGSAITYLERYTLLAAVGMATGGQDDDGNSTVNDTAKKKEMDQDEFDRLCGLIENAGSIESLKQIYLAAAKDAQQIGDSGAIKQFAQIKDKRYKELANANR